MHLTQASTTTVTGPDARATTHPLTLCAQFPRSVVNCIALEELDLTNNRLEAVPLEFGVSLLWCECVSVCVHVAPASQGLLSLRRLDLRGNSKFSSQIPEYLLDNSEICMFILRVWREPLAANSLTHHDSTAPV